MIVKTSDNRGRVQLPKEFSNKPFIFEIIDGKILLTPAVVVPEEQWLFSNPEALASVQRGIADIKEGRFDNNPPNIWEDETEE